MRIVIHTRTHPLPPLSSNPLSSLPLFSSLAILPPPIPLHCLLSYHFTALLRRSSASFPQDLPFPFCPPPPRRHPPCHRHLSRPLSLSNGSPLRRTGGAMMEGATTTAPPSALPSTSPQWPPSDSLAWRWGPLDLAGMEVGGHQIWPACRWGPARYGRHGGGETSSHSTSATWGAALVTSSRPTLTPTLS